MHEKTRQPSVTRKTPARRRRDAQRRRRQENRWADKAGPVTVAFVTGTCTWCGDRIDDGQTITRATGGWRHQECAG